MSELPAQEMDRLKRTSVFPEAPGLVEMSDAAAETVLQRILERNDLYVRAFGILMSSVVGDRVVRGRVLHLISGGTPSNDCEHEAVRRWVIRRIQTEAAEMDIRYPALVDALTLRGGGAA